MVIVHEDPEEVVEEEDQVIQEEPVGVIVQNPDLDEALLPQWFIEGLELGSANPVQGDQNQGNHIQGGEDDSPGSGHEALNESTEVESVDDEVANQGQNQADLIEHEEVVLVDVRVPVEVHQHPQCWVCAYEIRGHAQIAKHDGDAKLSLLLRSQGAECNRPSEQDNTTAYFCRKALKELYGL